MRKYILAIIILVIIFGGLKNIRQLSDLLIVRAIGIDITEDGKYEVYAIVADSSQKDDIQKGKIYSATGDTVQLAIQNIVNISSQKLYLAHMETLIISEKIATEDLENTMDFFIRNNEGSNSFYMFIANSADVGDIVECINEEEIDMASFLESSQKYKGNINLKNVNDLIKDILKEGLDICINSITIEDEKIKASNMAYFDGWTMKGYLEENESILYNMVINETENVLFTLSQDDDLVTIQADHSKVKMSIKDGSIYINVKLNATIVESGKNLKITTEEEKDQVEQEFEKEISQKIVEFISKIKTEYNVDILGLGNLAYRKKDSIFEDENYLEKVDTYVSCECEIISQGGVRKTW